MLSISHGRLSIGLWTLFLSLSSFLWNCGWDAIHDVNTGLGTPFAELTLPITRMDSLNRAIHLRQTIHRCNGATLASVTVDTVWRYAFTANGKVLVWENQKCYGYSWAGKSSSILGEWTQSSLDQIPPPLADRGAQCVDTLIKKDSTGLIRNFTQVIKMDTNQAKISVYGTLCLGDIFADTLVKMLATFQIKAEVKSKNCQTAEIRNKDNGQVAMVESSLKGGTIYATLKSDTATCRLATLPPFPLNGIPPNCSDVNSQNQTTLGFCILGSKFITPNP